MSQKQKESIFLTLYGSGLENKQEELLAVMTKSQAEDGLERNTTTNWTQLGIINRRPRLALAVATIAIPMPLSSMVAGNNTGSSSSIIRL